MIRILATGAIRMSGSPRRWLEIIQDADVHVAGFAVSAVLVVAQYFGAFSEPPEWIILAAWFGAAIFGLMIGAEVFVDLYAGRGDSRQSHPYSSS
jgi:hypothetical protein